MRTEILEFRRCCMCLPLRYSLIVWGYFRLLLAGTILVAMSLILSDDIRRSRANKNINMTSEIVIISLVFLLLISDIIFGVMFIVGCHKKNAALIRKCYYHNIFLLVLFIPITLYNLFWSIRFMLKYETSLIDLFLYIIVMGIACFTYIVIQLYIVLLVRSQFVKLQNGCQFRFDNHIAEPQCSLNIDGLNGEVDIAIDKKEVNDNDKLTNSV